MRQARFALMHQARFVLQLSLGFAAAIVLVACGQNNPLASSPSVESPQASPLATTAPYTVALACTDSDVAEYKPDAQQRDRTIDYQGHYSRTTFGMKSVTYDSSGNLYVAYVMRKGGENWGVDEFAPGGGPILHPEDAIRHITDRIRDVTSMTTDPDGNLYVAEAGKSHQFLMFKPKETKAAVRIDDFTDPADVVFAKGHLWVADYVKNEVTAYHIYPTENKAVLAWLLDTSRDGLHGPKALAEADSKAAGETNGNLYILNVPFAGDDYVKEFAIWPDREPRYARDLPPSGDPRLHFIKAIATDTNENVYLFEVPVLEANKDRIYVYDRNGAFVYNVEFDGQDRAQPYTVAAIPDRLYEGHGFNVKTYTGHGDRSFDLETPPSCFNSQELTLMQPAR